MHLISAPLLKFGPAVRGLGRQRWRNDLERRAVGIRRGRERMGRRLGGGRGRGWAVETQSRSSRSIGRDGVGKGAGGRSDYRLMEAGSQERSSSSRSARRHREKPSGCARGDSPGGATERRMSPPVAMVGPAPGWMGSGVRRG